MIKPDDNNAPITLAAPGQGLPPVELFIARQLVSWQSRRQSVTKSSELFAKERILILNLVRPLTESQGNLRVLIKRLTGLEDSSRYWSVFMTLDHISIVNLEVFDVIKTLVSDELPDRVARTEAVKPTPGRHADSINEFIQACECYENSLATISGALKTRLKWSHPWFGPFDAAQWHFIVSFHMGLHRRQIESICKALSDGC